MVNLPWDILLDVLVRLPLKSIVRFTCVNRLWHDELKRTKFLQDQRRFASETGKFNLMLHIHNDIDTFSVDPSLLTCERDSRIEYPVESLEKGIEVFGCCYGFVLLRHVNKLNKCVLLLWNPTTNECKRIPNPPVGTKDEDREYEEYALGYSERIEDFKVVYLTEALEEGQCEVQVYMLKSNSWRRVDNVKIDDLYRFGLSDMVRRPVGGAAHWLGYVEANLEVCLIIRFDFETEEFDGAALPEVFDSDLTPTLCALGGSVCFFIHDFEVTTMWELKQNGVEKSWNKLFTVELTKQFGSVLSIIPLKSLRSGKIVLGLSFGIYLHIVVYDPKHDTVETLKVHESMVPTAHIFVYEESLHSLDTGTPLAQLQWEDDDAVGGDGEEE